MPRALKLTLLVLAGLAVATLVALGASAFLDRPARVVSVRTEVDARNADAWDVLIDFAAYDDWNPFIREAEGEAREGGSLGLGVVLPGHDPESLDATILILHPDRKLRWQDRLLVPGLRDWEYEFVLEPLAAGGVSVVQQLRVEGLLAPFADTTAVRQALEQAAEALRQRLATQPAQR